MNEPELKSAAFALAEATPRHLDQPTTPPIHWQLEGDQLRVLLADGRTVRGPARLVKIVFVPADSSGMPTGHMPLPDASPKKAMAAAKSPAKHKAGK